MMLPENPLLAALGTNLRVSLPALGNTITGPAVAPAQFCVGVPELPVSCRKEPALLESIVIAPPRSSAALPRLVRVTPYVDRRLEIARLEPCSVKLVVPLRT